MDTNRITSRARDLEQDDHLIEQVQRLMQALRLIRGTADVPSRDDIVREAALGVAIIEDKIRRGEEPTPVYGVIIVAHNPASGYDLLLRGATVYTLHIGGGVMELRR